LINCLSPVVRFLHALSGTLGEALVLVRSQSSESIPLFRLELYAFALRYRFHPRKQSLSASMSSSRYGYPLISTESLPYLCQSGSQWCHYKL
jgi:hypothetical protein